MFRAHVLIVRRSKFYYTASGIITPVGGRPVHKLREDCARDGHLQVWCYQPSSAQVERGLCTGRPPTGVMIPAVQCTGWERTVHGTATYRCDDTRRCIIQFWPPDDGHMVLETCRGRGGVWGWQVGRPPQAPLLRGAPRFRPMSLSSYILR